MVFFAKILPQVLLAILFTFTTSATVTPFPATFKPSTHRTHYLGTKRSFKLETFHPESTFEGFGVDGADLLPIHRRNLNGTLDTGGTAVAFLASKLNVSEDCVHHRTSAQGQVAHHVFLVQKINGVPVANAAANVAFNNDGKISSFSSSFVEHSGASDINPSISLGDAIATAEKTLDGTYDGHPSTIEFVVQPNGFAALAYVIQIRNSTAGTWYEAFVDAHHNTVLSVTNFVSRASYRAIPVQMEDPETEGFVEIVDPQDLLASPNGWHREFRVATAQTDGNNVLAYTRRQLFKSADESSPTLNFIYNVDPTQDPTSGTNVQAALTNAFYVVNSFHDITYRYGFTETTFNFQTNNFGKGGKQFDRIDVSVQDPRGTSGADFASLPDGQPGELRLFLYDDFTPSRESAFQNEIILHECQHGANNRMTGGGTARCFETLEAAGLDEGYADIFPDVLSQNWDISDFIIGRAITDRPTGIRRYIYSTDDVINPLRYSDLDGLTDPHALGEVWANTLHNVYAALDDKYGWSWEEEDPTKLAGNIVFFRLLYDALLLEPCNPTFVQARDAWIQADANRYGGTNKCLLWRKFASKGLGVNAANYVDDTSVPPECSNTKSPSGAK